MKLLFVVTEDWFFRSHFLPLARRARAEGYEVVLAARKSGAIDAGEGIRVVDTPFSRRSLRPWDVGRQVAHLRAVVEAERPEIIHAIALKPIALVLLAQLDQYARVFALTGRGYLAVNRTPFARFIRWRFRRMLRRGLDAPRSVLLVENTADRVWLEGGDALPDERVVLMPGAGVDVTRFTPTPEPAGAPIVVGVVARLIRSKGIDLVIAAISELRGRSLDIVARIAGNADPENPEHVPDAEIAAWRATPGVELVGAITDVPSFWARAHIACLASRGGEGLPRSLLEASACGRPVVTTDVPGCADLVRQGSSGIVVPSNDVSALAAALEGLAKDGQQRQAFGFRGSAQVRAQYTEGHAAERAAVAWRKLGLSVNA